MAPSGSERDRVGELMKTAVRVLTVIAMAAGGFVIGGIVSFERTGRDEIVPTPYQEVARNAPLPHHVPQYSGGLSFRFAMIHDVLHERFEKHGRAWYEHRNRLNLQRLNSLPESDSGRWPILDDLAAGLDRLDRPDEAVELMRGKLSHQQELGLTGRDLYTSYANLGTFLIHASAKAAFAGDAEAVARFAEGVELVKKSVEVNPEAHFGRERWQAIIAEFLLTAVRHPALLREYDCLGNRLSLPVKLTDDLPEYAWPNYRRYGRPHDKFFKTEIYDQFFAESLSPVDFASPELWQNLVAARKSITVVGEETDYWPEVETNCVLPFRKAPFDEPMLGIIGMWRQGGGANPHFSLAIGETMLRIGQRYLAWAAFARTELLADRYSPDPLLQQFLRDHCQQRKRDIETSLQQRPNGAYSIHPEMYDRNQKLAVAAEKSELPHAAGAELQRAFDQELKFGLDFQRALQEFESRQLEAGITPDAPDFYDAFHSKHPPIASPVGQEEYFRFASSSDLSARRMQRAFAGAVFGSGCAAMIPAICFSAVCLLRRGRSGQA